MSDALDGRNALRRVIEQSEYGSVECAVAQLALFAHPHTLAQTQGRAIFPVIRARGDRKRRTFVEIDRRRVMADDNKAPTDAVVWAHGIRRSDYRDIQFNHVWANSQDPEAYTNLANICVLPAFLSKLTDTDARIKALLQYRSYDLSGGWTPDGTVSRRPDGYDDMPWREPLDAVTNLETSYREAMRPKRRDSTTKVAREIGWLFSGFVPDPTV